MHKPTMPQLNELHNIIRDLHWMARRYADGRQSTCTSTFNDITRKLLEWEVPLNKTGDGTLWARDGGGRCYDNLSEAEAKEGEPPMWTFNGLERENEKLRKEIAELKQTIQPKSESLCLFGINWDTKACGEIIPRETIKTILLWMRKTKSFTRADLTKFIQTLEYPTSNPDTPWRIGDRLLQKAKRHELLELKKNTKIWKVAGAFKHSL